MVSETVEGMLARIAAPTPSGGGGAAVALAGAVAAGLVGMVAGVAAKHSASPSALEEIVAQAEAVRRRLMALIALDVEAYGKVIEARRRTDAGREEALRQALIGATEVPLEVAGAGARTLEHAVTLLGLARPSTRADVGVAGFLASAVLDGAAITVRSNLEALDDRAFVADARRRLDELARHGAMLRARLLEAFAA